MKSKNYTKDYLRNSIKYLRGEITQTKFGIQSLEVQIQKIKSKLANNGIEHDDLWLLRDKLNHKKTILFMYKKELKQKEFFLNKMFNSF